MNSIIMNKKLFTRPGYENVTDKEYKEAILARRSIKKIKKIKKIVEVKEWWVKRSHGRYNNGYPREFASRRKELFEIKGKICERCGGVGWIMLHHKDKNKENNSYNNLEILCFKCHKQEHPHMNLPSWMKYN